MNKDNQTEIKLDPASDTPVTVDVMRGEIIESRHRGSLAIVDYKGTLKGAWGDVKSPIYPRSSNKALQALALVESGAADDFNLDGAELALACSSHNGEPEHVATAAGMLAKAGLSVADLECGSHWPRAEPVLTAMAARQETPCALHNNCSGKHAGMLLACRKLGLPTKGYVKIDHPIQQRILGIIEMMCGLDLSAAPSGIDGCSIPTIGLPLENLAYGFARFIAPDELPETRQTACRRLAQAVYDNPFMVAGTDRFCTRMMEIMKGRVFVKTGAEGVYTAALPEFGLGVALKCEDGSTRAAEMMITAALDYIGLFEKTDRPKIEPYLKTPIYNCNRLEIGQIKPASGFLKF